MKKINSIHFGGRVIVAGFIFLVAIPLVLGVANRIAQHEFLVNAAYLSMIIGAVILGLFLIVLLIERAQDRRINSYYHVHDKARISLPGGHFECARCGNRNIHASDARCSVCGITFDTAEQKTAQDILNSGADQ